MIVNVEMQRAEGTSDVRGRAARGGRTVSAVFRADVVLKFSQGAPCASQADLVNNGVQDLRDLEHELSLLVQSSEQYMASAAGGADGDATADEEEHEDAEATDEDDDDDDEDDGRDRDADDWPPEVAEAVASTWLCPRRDQWPACSCQGFVPLTASSERGERGWRGWDCWWGGGGGGGVVAWTDGPDCRAA